MSEVDETGIIDDTGCRREIDVLVMCTGFQPANFLATFELVGRDGREIHEVWKGDAQAYLGLTVAGFPNFYMLYGPNTNGAPIMFMPERQVEFILANLRRMIKDHVSAIEVRRPSTRCSPARHHGYRRPPDGCESPTEPRPKDTEIASDQNHFVSY